MDSEIDLDHVKLRLTRATSQLIMGQPFFAALIMKMPLVPEASVETMETDGTRIAYGPSFVEELSDPELTAVLAHEGMHCALNHHTRRGDRDPMRWNMACDYAVNMILNDEGFQLPTFALLDHAFAGMGAEAIYAKLPESNSGGKSGKPGNGKGDDAGKPDPGRMGRVTEPKGDDGTSEASKPELKRHEAEWESNVLQAANIAKIHGKMPASMQHVVKEIKTPKINWRDVLLRFVTTSLPEDYSMLPPNRRHVADGLYLPSLRSERPGRIVLVIDTSGSVPDKALAAFQAEINEILEVVRPEAVNIIYCDAAVNKTEELEPDDFPFQLSGAGRGGTDFRPPFTHVQKNGIDPVCLIYLTDLEGPFPINPPDYPVLWVSTKDHIAPWGETLKLDI